MFGLLLNVEGGSDKRQAIIHTIHSKLTLPSKVSLNTFVTAFLIPL
jgi:hypothetical protein